MFVDPQLTVEQFKDMCTAEDEQVQSLEVLDGGKSIAPSQSLHSVLTDASKEQVTLKLNNTEYQFKKASQEVTSMHTKDCQVHRWDTITQKEGLKGIHGSSINTILNLTEQNLDFSKNCGAEQIGKAFKEQTLFFENAVIREETYKLNALRVAASNEFD